MLATPGTLPAPSEEHRWAFEMKWDGVRVIASVADGEVVLRGRSGRDVTATFPEVARTGESLSALRGRSAVLDGEVVAFDEEGRPSFAALQPRLHGSGRRPTPRQPVCYLVFDLLYLDGDSLLHRPYTARRQALCELGLSHPCWQVPPVFEGTAQAAMRASVRHRLEGVVAKRLDSPYEPGRRSRAWVKFKNIRTQAVVIGGWRLGAGSRASTFGSLLCGVYDGGRLRYVGRVGSGFTQETLTTLRGRLASLERGEPPFDEPVPPADARDARWVRPVLVGEVAYEQWTREGRLWHPTWRGLRPDLAADLVTREP
jgi:bifunctional non-homologous end joining protein LigD